MKGEARLTRKGYERCKAMQGEAWQGKAMRGRARKEKVRQGEARQQGKARLARKR